MNSMPADLEASEKTAPGIGAGDPPRNTMLYPPNVLDAFQSGAMLDLRVRFAMQMLATSPMFADCMREVVSEKTIALTALAIAETLFAQAYERGWCLPIPDGTDGPAMDALRAHTRRQADAGATGQLHGQKVAQDIQSGAIRTVSPIFPPGPGRTQGH